MIEYKVKVHDNGTREWYLNGKHHREDGPAVEFANGDKCWYLNGKRHREDINPETGLTCPAIEYANGTKHWFLNGNRHREDGPAIEYANGDKYWYLNNMNYSEANWKLEVAKLHKRPDPCDGKEVEIDGKKYKLTAV